MVLIPSYDFRHDLSVHRVVVYVLVRDTPIVPEPLFDKTLLSTGRSIGGLFLFVKEYLVTA